MLNTVFHLETSPGNIPWSLYQEVKGRGDVRYAIPYALGDNLYGYRIVGTTHEIFDVFEFQDGEKFTFQGNGEPFDEGSQTAVLGSVVAEKLGLKRGDTFRPYHGLQYMPGSAPHQELYTITGVLEPTNTANDGVIWIPIEGIFRMDGHKLAGGTEEVERGARDPGRVEGGLGGDAEVLKPHPRPSSCRTRSGAGTPRRWRGPSRPCSARSS